MNADQEMLKILEKWRTSNPRSLITPSTTDQLERSLNLNDFELGLIREIIGTADIATTLQQHRSKSPEDSTNFPATGATLPVVRDAVAPNRDFKAEQSNEVVSGGKDHLPKRRYKGVYLRSSGKFSSEIHLGKGERMWLGTYDTAEQAAMAFDRAAFQIRGSHAVLNFPDLVGTYNVSPEKGNNNKLSLLTEGSPESL